MQTNDLPIYLFRQGTNFESYRFFGAHPAEKGKQKGYCFRVWADNAAQISVIGSFNDWNPAAARMDC